jgi:hypothetical protein
VKNIKSSITLSHQKIPNQRNNPTCKRRDHMRKAPLITHSCSAVQSSFNFHWKLITMLKWTSGDFKMLRISVDLQVNNYQRPRLTRECLHSTTKWNEFFIFATFLFHLMKRFTRCFRAAAITRPLSITDQITGWLCIKASLAMRTVDFGEGN